jgi:hypothetical protein
MYTEWLFLFHFIDKLTNEETSSFQHIMPLHAVQSNLNPIHNPKTYLSGVTVPWIKAMTTFFQSFEFIIH